MDSDSDKPFVCTFPGCYQRFANNDHLVSHSNKHELSLKLGAQVAGGGAVLLVDQTPTPTRFLRNCEETGLFQELGNPFEQDFKHATNKVDEDDEDRSRSSSISSNEGGGNTVNSGGSGTQQLTSANVPVAPPPSLVNPQRTIPLASVPTHVLSNSSAFAKQKLLETIQNKQSQQQANTTISGVLLTGGDDTSETSSTNDYFQVPTHFPPRRRGRKPDEEVPEVKRQKFLERNRAAASRCRARKKQWVDGLEKKSKELEVLNTSLQQEVIMLKAEVQQLKSIIIAHKDCPMMNNHQHTKHDDAASSAISSSNANAVTLLSQLQSFANLSPLVASPPSATLLSSPLFLSALPTSIPAQPTANVVAPLEVGKNIEVSGDSTEQ